MVVFGHQPSASTQMMIGAGKACTAIKEKSSDQKLMMVGGHISALPERTLIEEDIDFVCYEVVYPQMTPSQQMEWLTTKGFNTVKYEMVDDIDYELIKS